MPEPNWNGDYRILGGDSVVLVPSPSANVFPCRVCKVNIDRDKDTEPWYSYSWQDSAVIHRKCMAQLPKCRECKSGLIEGYHTIVPHPSNPKLKYHHSCLDCLYLADGKRLYIHPTWTMTDHLGNKFIPRKHGLATYKARVGSGPVVDRHIAIKTMIKLKKAGVIKNARVDVVPDSWNGSRVDHIGDSNEPRFINSEGEKQESPQPDPNGYEYVGCELEVEQGEIFKEKMLKKKEIERIHASVGDGSLTRGVEVLTMPSAGRQFIKTVTTVANALSGLGWAGTKNCGAHAHVNFRSGHSFTHIKRAMMLCMKMEPFILDRIAPNRRHEHYCEPLSEKYDMSQIIAHPTSTIDQLVYGTSDSYELSDMKEDKYCEARYSGVNFHSIFFRGTIEFRYLEGTTDPKKLSSFGLLYAGIVEELHNSNDRWQKFWEKAKTADPETIVSKLMRTPSIKLLKRINPEFIK